MHPQPGYPPSAPQLTRLPILFSTCLIAGLGVALLFSGLSPARAQPDSAPSVPSSSASAVAGLSLGWLSPDIRETTDAVLGDIDNDGDLDGIVSNEGHENQVYLNPLGAGGGKFEDFEIRPLPGSSYASQALALGDVDGDGDLDLAIANNGAKNQVLLNQGGVQGGEAGQFSPQDLPGESGFSRDVAFGDVDGDGDLDLMFTFYDWYPTLAPNRLYINQGGAQGGAPGSFVAAIDLPGLSTPGDKSSRNLAVGDVDGDQDLDLVISGEGWPGGSNRLYTNQGGDQGGVEGSFVVSEMPGDQRYGGDVALGDIDNDGDLDVVIGADDWSASQLYTNQGGKQGGIQGSFTVQDLPGGLVEACSVALGDVDRDGDLDIALGNCYTVAAYPNYLLINQGGAQGGVVGQFTLQAFPSNAMITHSFAFGDIDNDSDLDLMAGNSKSNQLYLNQGGEIFGRGQFFITNTSSASTWGDVDGDGDLDLALGSRNTYGIPDRLFINQGGGQGGSYGAFSPYTLTQVNPQGITLDLDFGDVDNDGDLDLVAGRSPACDAGVMGTCRDFGNKLYLNQGGKQGGSKGDFVISDLPGGERVTSSIALGDVDRDGDLDFVAGNISTTLPYTNVSYSGVTQLYLNQGGLQAGTLGTFNVQDLPGGDGFTGSVAFGDVDGDGDLDLAVGRGYVGSPTGLDGNPGGPQVSLLYINQGGFQKGVLGNFIPQELPGGSDYIAALVFGDLDADGDLDLATANRQNYDGRGSNRIYTNLGGVQGGAIGTFVISNLDLYIRDTTDLVIGDIDGDSDLDLVSCIADHPTLYINQGGSQGGAVGEFTSDELPATEAWIDGLSLADMDSDGDLDLFTNAQFGDTYIYLNQAVLQIRMPDTPPTVQVYHPVYLGSAGDYATPQIISATAIAIPYRLSDLEGNPVGSVRGFYSLNGGGVWLEAVAAPGAITSNLAAPAAGAVYTFTWDTFASHFFGQSDQVVFRLEAYQTSLWQGPMPAASFHYLRSAPGPLQFARNRSNGYPFRAQGTLVRVLRADGAGLSPAQESLVMRKALGQELNIAMSNSGVPYHTDRDGYLIGSGAIGFGDQLIALWPYTTTERYTLYTTNASPIPTGLQAHVVTGPGLQTLIVSDEHPLLAFNLDISLEWDARNDGNFLADLEGAIQQASTVLFDISDGQIVIGNVNIFQNRENWLASDVVLYAQTGIRPRASMGGVVDQLTDDLYLNGSAIHNAYGPGQIRIGPNWDPFGASISELTVDWQRALAHEMAHYLLFLPDNYLGVGADGAPISIDCRGSFMTNTYDDNSYSEFLIRQAWSGECLDTIAEHTTGRVDWETVQRFYPELHAPLDMATANPGPAVQPLKITRLNFSALPAPISTLPARFFDVRRAANGLLTSAPRSQVFLFQPNGTPDLSDDQVLPLGVVVGSSDRIRVRGAQSGDRLCLFGPPDPLTGSLYTGCIASLGALDASIPVSQVSDWQPLIQAQAVTSVTLQITVSLGTPTHTLNVQFYPAYGAPGQPANAVWQAMSSADGGHTYSAALTLDAPTFEGWLRVWIPGADPVRESMSQLFLSPPWGPNSRPTEAKADSRAWGANNRQLGAPVASGDGQVSIFNFTDIFSDTGTLSLQALNSLPNLPPWLAQVGQGYRFLSDKQFPRAIAFDYLQGEVPDSVDESLLNIYYSPDEGLTWQRLPTQIEQQYNRATAVMPENAINSRGIYTLVVTRQMPALEQGWNLFSYPILDDRPVDLALGSIEGKYTSVYYYTKADHQWLLYDATVVSQYAGFAPLVNDLQQLLSDEVYWIYATEAVTPYLGVDSDSISALAPSLSLPPATYYGWVQAEEGITLTTGSTLTAWIDGHLCGSSSLVELEGQLAYKLQVAADNGNGCGAPGRPIVLQIGGYELHPDDLLWDNSQAWFRTLIVAHPLIALEQGWNLFSYPILGDRPVGLALASIDGKYTSVYQNQANQWRLYDAAVVSQHAGFAPLVNDLGQLQHDKEYWIYATQAVTLSLDAASDSSPALAPSLSLPPATYYGWVQAEEGITLTTGSTLTAWIDGHLCGSSSLVELEGQLAYKLQVAADNGNGCGAPGRPISLRVGEYELHPDDLLWDNSQAWFRILEAMVKFQTFLPLLLRQ